MEEIRDFLKRMLDEAAATLVELQSELDDLDIKIKENMRFLDILKKENSESFLEFSPRNVSYKNSEQIDKLDKTTNNQIVEKKNIEIKIDQYKIKIEELKDMIGKIDNLSSQNNPEKKIIEISDKDIIIDSINNIISYLPADPMRAKIELSNLKNNI